jgi:hypothetical protein
MLNFNAGNNLSFQQRFMNFVQVCILGQVWCCLFPSSSLHQVTICVNNVKLRCLMRDVFCHSKLSMCSLILKSNTLTLIYKRRLILIPFHSIPLRTAEFLYQHLHSLVYRYGMIGLIVKSCSVLTLGVQHEHTIVTLQIMNWGVPFRC